MYRWVYQAGNHWMPVDDASNVAIEQMYRSRWAGYITIYHNQKVYVDTPHLLLHFTNGVTAQIARTGY